MLTKPTFKICCNCGAHHPTRARLCANPKGCGPVSREDRRRGFKSIFRAPTAEEIAAKAAHHASLEALMQELLEGKS